MRLLLLKSKLSKKQKKLRGWSWRESSVKRRKHFNEQKKKGLKRLPLKKLPKKLSSKRRKINSRNSKLKASGLPKLNLNENK